MATEIKKQMRLAPPTSDNPYYLPADPTNPKHKV